MTWKTPIFVARPILFVTFLMTILLGFPDILKADIVAFDMVGSASQNLVSFTDDAAIPFTSAGDGFNKFQRGVSATIPFAVADDSAGSFPPDTLGIIKTGNTEEFFGIVDTNNPDTVGLDVVATWVFDISGAPDLSLSIDMGAMGDFEASDFFEWSYSIDGGTTMVAFINSVDEAGSMTYTMEGGATVTLDDPMLMNGVILTNDLAQFVAPVTGTGSQLTLILTANTDSGSEAIAFQNLVINSGAPPPTAVAFDMVGSASQNLVSFTDDAAIPFTSAGDGFNKFQRGVSATIPFAVADDSAGSYPPDTLGIIKTGDTEEFFGIVDTNNGDTGGLDVVASWVFDISGASDLFLSIDMGAMGDFEASDFFEWSYSIDGGTTMVAFTNSVDEAGSMTYTMESGTPVTLSDPMLMNGVVLTNDLAQFVSPVTGTGSQLTLILTANTDGGSETIAFQDLVISSGAPPPTAVAFDMVGSASQNLVSFTDDAAIPFTSAGDGFNKFQRGVSATIPFAVADDSAGSYPPDTLGIIKTGDTEEFFGIVDTNNGDTGGLDVVASWVFDISGASDLFLSIDMGAMGDFEASDFFEWSYSIDGGTTMVAFTNSVDEAGSMTYTMESGTPVTLSDPMLMNGVVLTNDLAQFVSPVTGTGSQLTLILTANTDGGSETIAFRNLIIGSGSTPPPTIGNCGDEAVFISVVQGSGPSSPLDGVSGVILEGVVVGDFQESDELRGFFLQEEDSDVDGDPQTSEGIFVRDNGFGIDVEEGDVIRVEGTVDEFFGQTQLTSITNMADCNATDTASASVISLPQSSVDDWETTEGMAIEFPQILYATGNFTQARYGEVDLAVDAPLDNPTNVVAPGVAANALQALNDLSRIQLDDGSTIQNPEPLPPYLGADNTLRVGDSVTNLTGVLGYSFGAYEVHPTAEVNFVRENERPFGPPDVGKSLVKVAAFNVLNYFTTLDDSGPICGPSADQGCRGADNAFEFDRQKAKLVSAITTLDADIVGLIELENAADNTPIADLVDGLNGVAGAGPYAYIATSAIGLDAIRQGIIYKPSIVMPVGDFEILDNSVDPDFHDDRNRPVLAQTFVENTVGERFTLAVNHLKSKGSPCDAVGDPDAGDGQGNCNLIRTDAAQALVDWLATDPTGSGDSDFLIVGDLNAYAMEDPVMVIEGSGYSDLIKIFAGTGFVDGAYSFSFFGQAGYLDHALSSPGLLPNVTGAAIWHINADEPSGLDYNSYNQPDLFNPDEFRSSDHDAIVVGLLLDEDGDGVWDGVDMCPATLIPESVPTVKLRVNSFALVDGDGVFDTTSPKGTGPDVFFDIFDTVGCSCEQIIEAQGLGKGQQKFGCSKGVMEVWVESVNLP